MTDTDPEGVLTPDELTPDDDRLQELAEDRFVISVEEDAPEQTAADAPDDPEPPDSSDQAPQVETAAVHDVSNADTGASRPNVDDHAGLPAPDTLEGAFALAVDADLDGEQVRFTEGTNDVATTFGTLVARYADAVAPGVPTDEAVAVLINNADLDVEATSR